MNRRFSLVPPPVNIVVRMPNWLGDSVMATPVLQALRQHFPQAKITAMCQHSVVPLLTHDPHIDAIMGFLRPSRWIHRQQHRDIIAPLRQEQFDLGILLTNSFSSAWWFWCGNVQRRIGFAGNMRSWLLSLALPFPENREQQHLVLTYQALLKPLDIAPSTALTPHLYLQEQEVEKAKELLQLEGWNPLSQRLIGINPGAAYGSAKCWLPDRFEALTHRLLEHPDVFIVYFGDTNTAPLVHGICKDFSDRVLNLATKTNLREFMALISLCNALLTNDSGPMHIAAALNVPLVALFGSTNPIKTGPYGPGPHRVISKDVSCAPCYKRVCPIDFRCMKRIEVDEVYGALVELAHLAEP